MKRKHLAVAIIGLLSLNIGLFTDYWAEGIHHGERIRIGLRTAHLCDGDGTCRQLPVTTLLRGPAERRPLSRTDGKLGTMLFVWSIFFSGLVLLACWNYLRSDFEVLIKACAVGSVFTAIAGLAYVVQTPNYLVSSWSCSLFLAGCVDLFIDLSHALLSSDVFDEIPGSSIRLDADGPITDDDGALPTFAGAIGPGLGRRQPAVSTPGSAQGTVSRALFSPFDHLRRSSAQQVQFDDRGIAILRPGRLRRAVPWESIVRVELYRLPSDAPYDGSIVCDLWQTRSAGPPALRLRKTTEGNFTAIDPHSRDYGQRLRALLSYLARRHPHCAISESATAFIDGNPALPHLKTEAELRERLAGE